MIKRKRITLPEALQALLEYQKIPIRFLGVPPDDTVRIKASRLDISGVQLSRPVTRNEIIESIQESHRNYK